MLLYTFCELQGSVEVDVLCKYSGGMQAADVSNSRPQMHHVAPTVGSHYLLPTAVTSRGLFCFCSFRTRSDSLVLMVAVFPLLRNRTVWSFPLLSHSEVDSFLIGFQDGLIMVMLYSILTIVVIHWLPTVYQDWGWVSCCIYHFI